MFSAARALIFTALLGVTACARYGVVDDGTSISYGWSFAGTLIRGTKLPPVGEGYRVPPRWIERGHLYGTEELAAMIAQVGRRVYHETGRYLGVGDLSRPAGGPSRWHRSHQTGRDVDLLMFAVDRKGRSLGARAMVRFGPKGRNRRMGPGGKAVSTHFFDTARNWVVVRALLEQTAAPVQTIYIYEPLEQRLLEHARRIGEPAELIARADAVMEQPWFSTKHNDHFHVRIYCQKDDRSLGCRDGTRFMRRGLRPLRKYRGVLRASATLVDAALQMTRRLH